MECTYCGPRLYNGITCLKNMFPLPHQSLLELFEDSLAEGAQEEASETDYDGTKQGPEHGLTSRGWSLDQDGDQETLIPERSPPPAESHSRTPSLRSRLQDLLMAAKKRSSGCFGGRMDRIGNASGLGCNSGRGKAAAEGGRGKSDEY